MADRELEELGIVAMVMTGLALVAAPVIGIVAYFWVWLFKIGWAIAAVSGLMQ